MYSWQTKELDKELVDLTYSIVKRLHTIRRDMFRNKGGNVIKDEITNNIMSNIMKTHSQALMWEREQSFASVSNVSSLLNRVITISIESMCSKHFNKKYYNHINCIKEEAESLFIGIKLSD